MEVAISEALREEKIQQQPRGCERQISADIARANDFFYPPPSRPYSPFLRFVIRTRSRNWTRGKRLQRMGANGWLRPACPQAGPPFRFLATSLPCLPCAQKGAIVEGSLAPSPAYSGFYEVAGMLVCN